MSDDYKLMLGLLFVAICVLIVARFPALLAPFIRRPTARCGDGTLSFSSSRCGTCSHHGGVDAWLAPDPAWAG